MKTIADTLGVSRSNLYEKRQEEQGASNRHGLIVDAELMPATGTAEREAAVSMLERLPGSKRISLGADKHYDTKEFVAALRRMEVTPHVAQNTTNRRSAIDGRTTCHPNYRVSQRIR